jgi:DNA-binding CsgD family transcriptional regulator/tetratricopeptide (TPR) repeat protein
MAAQPLLGREQELREVDEILGRASQTGGALLIRGEVGVGKSSIVAAAISRAEASGMRVLRTAGVESETNLPFAGLHQLLRPWIGAIDQLASPQRAAIRAALGMADEAVPDSFLVGLATLNLLADLAESVPVLVVADDAQWLDSPTVDVLTFVARRLGADAITLIAAIREGIDTTLTQADMPELRLGPLNEGSAKALLDRHAPSLSAPVRARVLSESIGNALALTELPKALAEQLPDDASLPAVLPLTQRLERAFAARVALMPRATRRVLLVAAADEGSGLGEIVVAARAMGEDRAADALESAIDADLIHLEGDNVRFRHPLVRSAVYQSGSRAERRAAHAALAETFKDQPDRRAWHLGASVLGKDESVADELDRAATRALQRGAPIVAVAALEQSARLSEVSPNRARRLLQAAELSFQLGQADSVDRLLDEAEQLELGPTERGRSRLIREMFDDGIAAGLESIPELASQAAQAQREGDTGLALGFLRAAALRSFWRDTPASARQEVVEVALGCGLDEADPRLIATLAHADPFGQNAAVLRGIAKLRSGPTLDPLGAHLAAFAAAAVNDMDTAFSLLPPAISAYRAQGRLALLAQVLSVRALMGVLLGQWTVARSAADEAARLAAETKQTLFLANAKTAQASLAGLRGDESLAQRLATEAEGVTLPVGGRAVLCAAQLARGFAALSAGRYSDAYESLRRMFDPTDPAYHHGERLWGLAEYAEAAALSDHRAEASAVVDELWRSSTSARTAWLVQSLRFASAFLADDDEAESAFAATLTGDPITSPFLRARLELAYGSWLRRHRRVAESRPWRQTAQDRFDALGAIGWGARARQERRASGITRRSRSRGAWDQLSPQELQIAQMAAEGLSNRDIGQELYLSPRTVGSHLYRIFPKLGVSKRNQLHLALEHEVAVTA